MEQAERQRRWYVNLTPEQREARRIRQRVGFDHTETMSPEARSERARRANLVFLDRLDNNPEFGARFRRAQVKRGLTHAQRGTEGRRKAGREEGFDPNPTVVADLDNIVARLGAWLNL
jgi:hypothetical protein